MTNPNPSGYQKGEPLQIVDLQRVQCVSMSNGVSFEITLVSGVVVKGQHAQFSNFMNKYMSYVESKC